VGLTWIWTPALPAPLLQVLARVGLLDVWLLLDLLTASGVVGGAAMVALAMRERGVAILLLATVSATSLAAAVVGAGGWAACYAVAYATASALIIWSGPVRERSQENRRGRPGAAAGERTRAALAVHPHLRDG
ncbi:hypothetical protein JYK22_39110, partial [Nonomuraea sp. RK-328]|nr:hypothetical protein [Nonomuraea sp. RK-328]